jgi:hypothetical protein
MQIELGLEADFYGVDNTCFKLDDCVFEAVEDESDGYRSCMEEVRMKDNTDDLIFFQTPLARVRVEDASDYEKYAGFHDDRFEGYKLVDVNDGHSWLVFGTDHSDSYYPSFTFYYQTKGEAMLNILGSNID